MKPLEGKIALVAGATRGAGRGIARMLGEAGATVYCTGRSSRTKPNTSGHHYAGRPETIEETAEMVDAVRGIGIPVRIDHTVEEEVARLFKRVKRERKRLDVLVNILTGPPVKSWSPFWKQSLQEGRAMVDQWVWPHVTTCRYAVPILIEQKAGLIVEIVEQESIGYHGQFFFDLVEICLKRLAFALASELAALGVTCYRSRPASCAPRPFSRSSVPPSKTGTRWPKRTRPPSDSDSFIPKPLVSSGELSPRWLPTPTSLAGRARSPARCGFLKCTGSPIWMDPGPISGPWPAKWVSCHVSWFPPPLVSVDWQLAGNRLRQAAAICSAYAFAVPLLRSRACSCDSR